MSSSTATAPPASPSQAVDITTTRPILCLFLISVVGLFLELLLIRWVCTEIRIFAYLQNTILVVCFLGLGMGCWDSRKPFVLRELLIPLAVLVALLAIPTTRVGLGKITQLLSAFGDLLIWGDQVASGWEQLISVSFGICLTFMLMVLVWEIFVPVGRLLGRLMSDYPNTIAAYSVNVAGSLVGIWLFVLASALYLPPVAWFAVFGVGAAFFLGTGGKARRNDALILALVVGLGAAGGYEPGYEQVMWTPYQKLAVAEIKNAGQEQRSQRMRELLGERSVDHEEVGRTYIGVNNTGYQATIDLRPETVLASPERYNPAQRGYSQYDIPPKLHPNPTSMLVVGAGSGNDAAGALRNGATRVVAVEIDPGIIDIGRRLHPEQPYSNPNCIVVNDDARSYFATCNETFDVIAFGLLDSHTTTAMTNARLDHYVYTTQSLAHARKLLKPGGILVLSFESQKPYVADRLAGSLEAAFGYKPVVFRVPKNSYGWGGVLFVMGDSANAVTERIAANPVLAKLVAEWQAIDPPVLPGTTMLATDDWPYLYLEQPAIPSLYFLLAAALALLFVRGLWRLNCVGMVTSWNRSSWHFAFLGAAFMLLEVQNISKASVVLGNTWTVNAVIISGVMIMILLANLIAARFPKLPLPPVYALLVGSCVGLYFLDLSTFAFLPYATKAAVVGLLTSLPMLFSGIVFIRSFAVAEGKDTALGANMFGALVGALVQTVTFLTGIKALLLIVAAFYFIAVLTRPRSASAN